MAQNGAVIVFCSSCKILCLASSVHPKIATEREVTQMLLGVIEVLGLTLLRSKLFLLSPAPNPSNARGR